MEAVIKKIVSGQLMGHQIDSGDFLLQFLVVNIKLVKCKNKIFQFSFFTITDEDWPTVIAVTKTPRFENFHFIYFFLRQSQISPRKAEVLKNLLKYCFVLAISALNSVIFCVKIIFLIKGK